MVLFKEHIQKKKAGKNEARQKYNKTHNICTNMFFSKRLKTGTETASFNWSGNSFLIDLKHGLGLALYLSCFTHYYADVE